jgi:hypothetical protein
MRDSLHGQNLDALRPPVEYLVQAGYSNTLTPFSPAEAPLSHDQDPIVLRLDVSKSPILQCPLNCLVSEPYAFCEIMTDAVRAAGGSPGSAYAPLCSKYPTRPGIARVLDHSFFLQRCSRLWFVLLQGAFVYRD